MKNAEVLTEPVNSRMVGNPEAIVRYQVGKSINRKLSRKDFLSNTRADGYLPDWQFCQLSNRVLLGTPFWWL